MRPKVRHLLLVDASEELQPLAAALQAAGLAVSACALDDVTAEVEQRAPDILLFDVTSNPDPALLRRILEDESISKDLPAIALIAEDQIGSFDLTVGFADFVAHPARVPELLARIQHQVWLKSGADGDLLHAGDLIIDRSSYRVYVAGRPVDLTYKEYQLLLFLASNPDRVFTRDALLNRVWGYDFYGGARTVDVHIRRVRSKIEDRTHTFIDTVRNVGYRFRPAVHHPGH